MITGMGDIQADFMQTACAAEVLVPQGKLLNGYVFGVAQAVHEGLRGISNAFGLVEADVVAFLELGRCLLAHIDIEAAAD